MVHALKELWRVLVPGGFLIDLCPFTARPPLDIIAGDAVLAAGSLDDTEGFPDDLAANDAIKRVTADGWFARERSDSFDLYTYWDTMAEFQVYMDKRMTATLPPETHSRAERLLAQHGPGARLRTHLHMIIARYRKTPAGQGV